jgi:hypothetical protein
MPVSPTTETLTQAREGMIKSLMDVAELANQGHLSGLLIVGILTDGRQSVATVLDGRTHPFILTGAVHAHLNQTSDAVLRSVAAQSAAFVPVEQEVVTGHAEAATQHVSAFIADLTPDT